MNQTTEKWLNYKKNWWIKNKKVWQNTKNERGGSSETNESRNIDSEVYVLPRSSFVLEPDYADIAKRLRPCIIIPDNNLMIRVKAASHVLTVHLKDFDDGERNLKLHFDKEPMALMEDQLWVGLFLIFCVIRQD